MTKKIPFLSLLLLLCVNALSAQVEICNNRIDDDGDGQIDCLDGDCYNDDSCWQCVTEFYQVHSNQYLVSLEPASGTYTTIATISGASQINGAQFNPVDGHVYAPSIINGEHKLGMLQQDGQVFDTGLALPGNGIFYVGAIDAGGKMYLSNSLGIHSVDLNVPNLSITDLGVPHPGVADFSLDITNGLFYGITGSAQLKVFDPYTLDVSTYSLAGSINNDPGGYGAAWSCNDGSFFAYNNTSGKIYTIDIVNLTATEILNATGNLSINDGFNCVLAPPPFESNCGNGSDDDNDGVADCDDPDCFNSNQCTIEICNNGIDDDNDGWIDCSDSECYSLSYCVEICDNGIDDNGNGLIDSDDPQCNTTSGVSGGLESNRRLSDKIALRNFYTKVLNPKKTKEIAEGVFPFVSEQKSQISLSEFVPSDILDAYVSESTPTDLVEITNAIDVVAADYFVEDQRRATMLLLHTEEGVYEHTKYICDRLEGARLLDVSYLFAKGGNFISYELLSKYGQIEYAVSFGAQYSKATGFNIESHWNLHKYQADAEYYNFQLWASTYEELIVLLESTLDKMSNMAPIANIIHSEIPKVFVKEGNYKNGRLNLVIRNKNQSTKANFTSTLSRNEGGQLENLDMDINLTGAAEEAISIETGALYDIGASLNFENSISDELFAADGSWGIDNQNPNAIVHDFSVTPDQRDQIAGELSIERNIEVSASVKDYLNIYRSLDAKLNPVYLENYDLIEFKAAGTGMLEVTIVKAGIENWEDQARTVIELQENEANHVIKFDDFAFANAEHKFNDATMIVFTLIGDNNTFIDKNLSLSETRFRKSNLSSSSEIEILSQLEVNPNPTTGFINCSLPEMENMIGELKLVDNMGKVLLQQNLSETIGKRHVKIDVQTIPAGMYHLVLDIKDKALQKTRVVIF